MHSRKHTYTQSTNMQIHAHSTHSHTHLQGETVKDLKKKFAQLWEVSDEEMDKWKFAKISFSKVDDYLSDCKFDTGYTIT